MDLDVVEVTGAEDGDDSVLIISDDDDQDEKIHQAEFNMDSVEILTTPVEALITMHPALLMDQAKVTFTLKMSIPPKMRSNVPQKVKIAVSSASLENVSINISKSSFILDLGIPKDIDVFFRLKPKVKDPVSILMRTCIKKGMTLRDKQSVMVSIKTLVVDPDCCFGRLSDQQPPVIAARSVDQDYIVLFFVSEQIQQKIAIACSKREPFQLLVDAHASQFPANANVARLKFTNLGNNRGCHADSTPDSIGLQTQDTVFVSLCSCRR